MRKIIQLTAQLGEAHGMSDWRQHSYNVKQVKKKMRVAQQKKRASSKNPERQEKSEKAIKQAHEEMIVLSQKFLDKSAQTISTLTESDVINSGDLALMASIEDFTQHAVRQIDQISRRVLNGEVIPHDEKVFSIFQPHTEWISKGKAGVPVELGLRICVLEDHHQFILHHKVMEKETDDQVAVEMVRTAKTAYPNLTSCSFDKGFHSPTNQSELGKHLETVALKRKGKLSKKAQEVQQSDDFKKAQYKHSAVESAINALEVHGLDKCRDHGIDGFKRYVSLAIVTRNIHRIGAILHQRAQKQLARKKNRTVDRIELLAA